MFGVNRFGQPFFGEAYGPGLPPDAIITYLLNVEITEQLFGAADVTDELVTTLSITEASQT